MSTDRLVTHSARVGRMFADPDCVGELLLVGVAIARGVDLDDPAPLGGGFNLRHVGRALYGPVDMVATTLALPYGPGWQRRQADRGWRRVLDVVRADIRRYEPAGFAFHMVTCGRPMIRRGGVCGRSASSNHSRMLTDPVTGERAWVGACSQPSCRGWFEHVIARNGVELAEHPPPRPPANTGGVLERHMPEVDWWPLWRFLDPAWSPPPEDEAWHRPSLSLVVGGDEPGRSVSAGRPTLTVLPGGWR